MPVLAPAEKDHIKETVCTILELEPEEVSDSSLFKDDHGADSLLAIEILAQLERTFKITIDQSELERLVNLEGVYSVVAEAKAA
ncbi:polyketide-8 synthase acyl carrier protein [Nocardia sp. MDA0666]|uniref:acyl carrier protein n=1 Tax=Nocardia sp. MDA0666 TaxID=2135448 RepID=UPI000D1374EF|nr:acyl carrier protein [Nocardia sp. MDA0666]PSR68653.1 polyketide-8 synthase acyl carrier protein [Nocardia sp. MDA0666]